MGRAYRAELALLLADPRLRAVAAVLGALTLAVFALAWQGASSAAVEQRAAAAAERTRWLGQDPKNPHSAAHYGTWLFAPASPLAVLEPGVDPYTGRMLRIEAHKYNDVLYRPAQDAGPLPRTGFASLADLFQTALPLVALLLGFSAFALDRERGTLRLALGNGAGTARIVGARIGALLTITAALVAVPALCLGAFAILTLPSAGWAPWSRLLAWTGANLIHVAVFVALAVAVSLTARTARTALAVSLALWAGLCVAAPRLAVAWVEERAPTLSYQAARARAEAEIKRYNAADLHAARQAAILAAGAKVDLRGAMLHDREQHDYRAFDAALGAFNRGLERQDRLYAWAGALSPAIALQTLSTAAAASDHRSHLHFLTAAEAYRRVLSDTMNLDLVAHPQQPGATYLADDDVWARVPPFAYRPQALGSSLGRAWPAALALGLWLAASLAAVVLAARRMKP